MKKAESIRNVSKRFAMLASKQPSSLRRLVIKLLPFLSKFSSR